MSLITASFPNDPVEYICIGTAYVVEDEAEPSKGRIIIFSVDEAEGGKLCLTFRSDLEVPGAAYSLHPFQGKLLGGINASINIFKVQDERESGMKAIVNECGYTGHIVSLHLDSCGDFVIVGDLMKSISLLLYRPVEGTLDEISRDYLAKWMTSIAMLDADYYIGKIDVLS
jgi:DNA damage-binding protein 1